MTRGPKPRNGARLTLYLAEGQSGLTSEQVRLCVTFVLATGCAWPGLSRDRSLKPKLIALPGWMLEDMRTRSGGNVSGLVRGALALRGRHAELMAVEGSVGHETTTAVAASGTSEAVRLLTGRGCSPEAAWLFVGNLGRFRDGSV